MIENKEQLYYLNLQRRAIGVVYFKTAEKYRDKAFESIGWEDSEE